MKRSEMIYLMLETMQANGLYDANYGTDEYKLAESVLDAIEKAGMFAPPTPSSMEYNAPIECWNFRWEKE